MDKVTTLTALAIFLSFVSAFGIRASSRQEQVRTDDNRGSGLKVTLANDKLLKQNEVLTSSDLGYPRTLTVCVQSQYDLRVEGSIDGSHYYWLGATGGAEGRCISLPPVSWVRVTYPSEKTSFPISPERVTAQIQAVY